MLDMKVFEVVSKRHEPRLHESFAGRKLVDWPKKMVVAGAKVEVV